MKFKQSENYYFKNPSRDLVLNKLIQSLYFTSQLQIINISVIYYIYKIRNFVQLLINRDCLIMMILTLETIYGLLFKALLQKQICQESLQVTFNLSHWHSKIRSKLILLRLYLSRWNNCLAYSYYKLFCWNWNFVKMSYVSI